MSVSIGNVFVDLGIDGAEKTLKNYLVLVIKNQITLLGLSQGKAAALIGISQPDVCNLVRGRISGYSLERLFVFARVLGGDVEIAVRAAPGAREGRMSLRLEMEAA